MAQGILHASLVSSRLCNAATKQPLNRVPINSLKVQPRRPYTTLIQLTFRLRIAIERYLEYREKRDIS